MMQQDIYTTQEAALFLGVSRPRVLQFIREKRLPATQHGRVYLIYYAALEEFKGIARPRHRPRKLIGKTP